jgi:hypothetical protein
LAGLELAFGAGAPAFVRISLGSSVHSTFEMLSMFEPAAPSNDAPAARSCDLTFGNRKLT